MRETSAAIADRQQRLRGLRIARTGGSSAISWRGGLRLLDRRGGRRCFQPGGFSRRGVWFKVIPGAAGCAPGQTAHR